MANDIEDPQEQALLRRRLVQFCALVFVAFVFTAVQYGLQDRLDVTLILSVGAAVMPVCLWLAHRHSTYSASALLLVSTTGIMSTIMWRSDGLQDSAMLAYPVILVGSAQLLKPRHFLAILITILCIVVVMGLGTIYGWRPVLVPGTMQDRITDSLMILLVSSALTWFLTSDRQRSLLKLGLQIKALHASEKNLTFLAQHDSLTRLPNRILGSELVELGIAAGARRDAQVALLFVDLDNFKDINDSLGHSAGDEFLKEVARRLLLAVRQSDVVCRQGGDEFLVGLLDMVSHDDITQAAQKVLESMRKPFLLGETEILATCSIGVAVYPKDGNNFEDLLRHADLAMYHSKEAGRNTFRFFDEEINASIRENLHLISSLRAAILQQEFVLHYQPIFDLATGALVGAEALVRWQNPKLGMVSPAMFIPTAEKSGLIVDIGQWVIAQACRQMRAWHDAGAPRLVIAVNLSPVQFRRGNAEEVLENALRESGLDPACLELEVTESTLVQDTERFIQSLQRIKALGVRIAIDDFGTGYSNLSYLQRFAVDKLKIDQSFVRRLLKGPQDAAIVNAIIQMAKSLHLTTNAEGVEDEATRLQLLAMGCELAQGYLFAKPMPADQFADFIRASYPENSHNLLAPNTALG